MMFEASEPIYQTRKSSLLTGGGGGGGHTMMVTFAYACMHAYTHRPIITIII